MVKIFEILKSHPSFSRRLVCRDLMFTQYDCPQTVNKERFYLECNLVVYVMSGKRIFHRDKKRYDLSEGSCVFIRKGTHISEIENGEGWCVMAFFMPDHFLKQLVNENARNLPLSNLPETGEDNILPLHVNDICKSFFFSMLSYFSNESPPPESLVELKFKELILTLLSEKQNAHLMSYLNNLRNDRNPSVAEIVQRNFTFNLTLPEYANLACMSLATFKREFKRIFKDSPARWMTKKRLELAVELLENTTLSIGEITFECGFENQTHFSRVFKQKFGMSPLKFRGNLAHA